MASRDQLSGPNPLSSEDFLAEWFCSTVLPGDLVLTGCTDMVSRLIQLFTRSQVSHAAIVTGSDTVVEAYDYTFTPVGVDGGIFETPFETLLNRGSLDRIVIRRPVGLDLATLERATRYALDNAPPFPTVGLSVNAVLIMAATAPIQWGLSVLRQLGWGRSVDQALDRAVGSVADGPQRGHCSETATRLYIGADLHLIWKDPVLAPHMNRVRAAVQEADGTVRVSRRLRGAVASLDRHFHRRASRSEQVVIDEEGSLKARAELLLVFGVAIAARLRARRGVCESADIADLILPADLEDVEPFDTVGCIVRRAGRWHHVDLETTDDPQPMEALAMRPHGRSAKP